MPMAGRLTLTPSVLRAGFTVSGRLATLIGAFRGLRRGFTGVTARTFATPVLRLVWLPTTSADIATCVIGISHGELLAVHETDETS